MTGGATIGATTAVDGSGKKASEKVISYMREEMAATAEKRGRSKEIARGMVDEELEFPSKIKYEYVTSDNEVDTIKTIVYYLIFDKDTIYVDDRTIDSHIKRLRKKFKSIDADFNQIRTRYGSGYSWRE